MELSSEMHTLKLYNFSKLSMLDVSNSLELNNLEVHAPRLEYIKIGENLLDRLGEVVIVTKKKNQVQNL